MGSKSNVEEFEGAIRVRAIESLLLEKGLLTEEAVDKAMQFLSIEWKDRPGRQVVARAWKDADFRKRLLENPSKALLADFKIPADIVVVENTDKVHNLSVCSLCSCYPVKLLGFPPIWYKSPEYRAKAVSQPRAVLREFGVELADDIEIRVWDSLAPPRHMVLPLPPENVDSMSEDELAEIVTPELCVGTAR
jgi:nitrile hydratase